MKNIDIIDLFLAAFNMEIENKIEIVDKKLVVHTSEGLVTISFTKMFEI